MYKLVNPQKEIYLFDDNYDGRRRTLKIYFSFFQLLNSNQFVYDIDHE